jgi:hypothetical protein
MAGQGNFNASAPSTGTGGSVSTAFVQPTGTPAGDAAVINADLIAPLANTYGGTVEMGAGIWHLPGGGIPPINRSGITFRWQPGSYVICSGSGDVIRMYDSSNINTRVARGGGILGQPLFDASAYAGAGTILHLGDIYRLQVFADLQNMGANGPNYKFENAYYYAERMVAQIDSENSSPNGLFTCSGAGTGSYDRADLKLWHTQGNVAYDMLQMSNGAQVVNGKTYVGGNAQSQGTPPASAMFRLAGAGAGFIGGTFDVGIETDGANAYGPQSINFAANTLVSRSKGIFDVSIGNVTQQSNNGGQWQYQGSAFGDPSLSTIFQPGVLSAGAIVNGGYLFTSNGSVIIATPAAAVTGIIMYPGLASGQPVTIVNQSAFTITFAVAGSNMALGAAVVIAANSNKSFTWDGATSLWY